MAEKSFLLDA